MTCRHKTILYIITAIILMVGLGSAVLIYQTAGNDGNSHLGYDASGGYVRLVASEDHKTYGHDSMLLGGKTKVPSDEFMHWFAGLWHGKSFAFTVTCITIYIFLGFIFVVDLLLSDL